MTQFQFDMICKILESGAPALANELITALSTIVKEANSLAKENEALKDKLADMNRVKSEPLDDSESLDKRCQYTQ